MVDEREPTRTPLVVRKRDERMVPDWSEPSAGLHASPMPKFANWATNRNLRHMTSQPLPVECTDEGAPNTPIARPSLPPKRPVVRNGPILDMYPPLVWMVYEARFASAFGVTLESGNAS